MGVGGWVGMGVCACMYVCGWVDGWGCMGVYVCVCVRWGLHLCVCVHSCVDGSCARARVVCARASKCVCMCVCVCVCVCGGGWGSLEVWLWGGVANADHVSDNPIILYYILRLMEGLYSVFPTNATTLPVVPDV